MRRVTMMTASGLAASLLMSGCIRTGPDAIDAASNAAAPQDCALPAGRYDLQSVTFHSGRGEYDLFVLGAPACVRQPLALERVKLARIDSPEKKAAAKLEVPSSEDPTLFLTEDYKIEMVNAVVENGQVVREESSSWMPFLAGAAGAAVVGMAMNSMFSRPQYYQPPPMKPGMAEVRGYGAAAPTHQGAISGYQSKYNAPPPSVQNKSFFRKKSDTAMAAAPQNERRASNAPSSNGSQPQKKRGFFRRRGR